MAQSTVPLGAERGRRAGDHGIDGDKFRQIWVDMWSDPLWYAAAYEFSTMDILRAEDFLVDSVAQQAATTVLGTQPPFRSVMEEQLVPADVTDAVEHLRLALLLQHPLDDVRTVYEPTRVYESERDAELRAAVRHTVALGVSAPQETERRRARIVEWSGMLRSLSDGLFERHAPAHIRLCPLPRTHPALVAALVVGTESRDLGLPVRMILGCPPAGDLPPINAWDRGWVPRPLGLDLDDLPHQTWNEDLARDAERRFRALSPTGLADHKAMWDKSIEERNDGYCEGPFDFEYMNTLFGPGRWRATRRFPIWQKGKLRVRLPSRPERSHGTRTAPTVRPAHRGVPHEPVARRAPPGPMKGGRPLSPPSGRRSEGPMGAGRGPARKVGTKSLQPPR